jgi:hypothetical protein
MAIDLGVVALQFTDLLAGPVISVNKPRQA